MCLHIWPVFCTHSGNSHSAKRRLSFVAFHFLIPNKITRFTVEDFILKRSLRMQGIRPRYTIVFRGSITPQTGAYFQNKTGSDCPRHATVSSRGSAAAITCSPEKQSLRITRSDCFTVYCILFLRGLAPRPVTCYLSPVTLSAALPCLFYLCTCGNAVGNEHNLAAAGAVCCGKQHTVAFNARKSCGLKVCNNNNLFADKLFAGVIALD